MTWLLKIKRRVQNAIVAWLDWPDSDWPGKVKRGPKPWRSAEPVSLPGDEGYDEAWLQAMQDPKTPAEIQQARIGAERIIAALRSEGEHDSDERIRGMTDGGAA